MQYKIVFEIEPVPASRPRVGKWGTYYNQTYAQFQSDMAWLIKSVKKTLFTEPLKLDVTFRKKIPESYSGVQKAKLHGTYCVSNMDLDNLEKALYDAMNGHVYVDDKQIVEHTTRKMWTKDKPCIEITLQKINE